MYSFTSCLISLWVGHGFNFSTIYLPDCNDGWYFIRKGPVLPKKNFVHTLITLQQSKQQAVTIAVLDNNA